MKSEILQKDKIQKKSKFQSGFTNDLPSRIVKS